MDTNSGRGQLELYGDDGSIVRHNPFVYRAVCDFNISCGRINIDLSTSGQVAGANPGRGTQIYDNIATRLEIHGSTVARDDHNMMRTTALSGDLLGIPSFVFGGAHPTSYAGYRLAPGSPGKGAASDGLDVGIR